MKIGLLQIIGGCLVGAVLTSGCVKEQLSVKREEGSVGFTFDWENLQAGDPKPQTVKLYFYGADNSVSQFEASSSAFNGALPAQTYKVLAFDAKGSTVEFRNMDKYETASVYARDYSGRMPFSRAGEHLIEQPLGVYGAGLSTLVVETDKTTTQKLSPSPYVSTIVLTLKVSGDEAAVNGCCARVSGVACGMNLATRQVISSGPAGSIVMDSEIKEEAYKAAFSVFGVISEATNELTLDFEFGNGGIQRVTVDITDALVDINKPIVPEVSIDVDVDVSKNVDGGFSATVTGWVSKSEDIEINRPNQFN